MWKPKPLVEFGCCYFPFRFHMRTGFGRGKHDPVKKSFQILYMGVRYINFTSTSAHNMATHHTQVAFERISRVCAYNGFVVSPIRKIAQAFSLASTRSHVVAPGIFAFICGEFFYPREALAEASGLMPRNSIYMHAEDGRARALYLLSSLLEGVIVLLRALYLAILFSPVMVSAPFANYYGFRLRKKWIQLVHWSLEKAGPAFIKWGQWAATRPDLFPRDLCAQLCEFYNKAPQHNFAYSKMAIEKAFGRKISDIFEDFDELPIASGSIAQVYRALLKANIPNRQKKQMPVAVKVRHPGVGESIKRDFIIINTIAKLSKLLPTLKWLRLDESVQQFAVFMSSQVDLAREAAHLSRFIYNFRGWKNVSFPMPVYPLVHPAVLVESFEQGECVSNYLNGIDGRSRIKSALAHIGTHALLKMLLVDNFIHADLHPGNILVREANNKLSRKNFLKWKPHVIFLDVGMTAELSRNDRVNLLEFFKAVARRDGRTAAMSTLKLSERQSCPDPDAFIEEVETSFKFWGTPEGDVVHPAECMQQLLEKVRRHKVNVDGNVCTVIVTTLVLEGWQKKLDPGYDIMQTLQKLLLQPEWGKPLTYIIERLMAP